MANYCDFTMQVKGEKENIKAFCDAMSQEGDIWMGQGADVVANFLDDNVAIVNGCCKGSVTAALICDAVTMKKQKETGEGNWAFNNDEKK